MDLEEQFRLGQIERDRILDGQIAQGWGGVESSRIPKNWRQVRGPEPLRKTPAERAKHLAERVPKEITFCANHSDQQATKRGMCNACYQRWLILTNPKYARRQRRKTDMMS